VAWGPRVDDHLRQDDLPSPGSMLWKSATLGLLKSAAAARWWAAASCRFPPFSWSLNQPRLPCPSSPAAASPASTALTRAKP